MTDFVRGVRLDCGGNGRIAGKGDRMAEYVTVVKELQRMCSKNRCAECPLTKFRHECIDCYTWMNNHPEEVERIVMAWSEGHPLVTNGMKFREVFGINLDSIEVVCRDGEGKVSHHQDVSAWLDKEYK